MKRLGLALALAGAATISAATASSENTYAIRFAAVVGDKTFTCGATYTGLGAAHSTVTPEFLRFYVYDVALIDATGRAVPLNLDQDGTWQQRNVAFLSFEGKNTACASGSPQDHRVVLGHAPQGNYVGLRFTVGVPQPLDHGDATIAASPLNLSDMFWSWQDGYKFLRFDARVRGSGARTNAYVFHLGSTGCTGNDASTRCAHTNEVVVTLRGFTPSREVAIDVARLVESVNLEGNDGCMMMSKENCEPALHALGLEGSAQTVFRLK